jgi:outer membrane lipopolysaccharide assembly protein LptE/RlpB
VATDIHWDQSSNPIAKKNELGGIIEDMKIDILHSLAMQMDTLKIKRKQKEAEKLLIV